MWYCGWNIWCHASSAVWMQECSEVKWLDFETSNLMCPPQFAWTDRQITPGRWGMSGEAGSLRACPGVGSLSCAPCLLPCLSSSFMQWREQLPSTKSLPHSVLLHPEPTEIVSAFWDLCYQGPNWTFPPRSCSCWVFGSEQWNSY